MVGGDQLTIDRLRKIIRYRATEDNSYKSRSWALPIIQIWHMKLAYLRSLINIHWFPKIGSDLFGFRQGTHALNRSIDPNKIDFYPCHDAVKVVFEGMVLTATYVLLQEEAGLSLEPTDRMLDGLGTHFAPGGRYQDCNLDKLEEVAGRIYARYMTTDVYQQALALREAGESSFADLGTTILEELGKLDEQPDYVPNPARSSGADLLLGNITLFMRDAFWYLELASAVPEGDVGRIFEVIKLLRFSFWGAAATNYGKELLELASNFLHKFSDSLRETVLNNYLVNPSGLAGRWQECDFFQEHSNKAIKSVFNSKNSEWDSGFLRNSVSVNITGLAHLRDTMLDFLGLRKPGSGQSQPDLTADINVLAKHYLEGQVFTFSPGRSQECVATDMFEAGLNKLEQGALKRFLERSAASRAGQLFEEPDPEDQGGDFVIPPEPLIMENGRLVPGEPNEP
ncbi:hypothetical protein FRC08_011031 [Ceratobasidium sp. 394]|nr:hypothetical protein FRC08_011031 [Ceratobasidium sp. 394]